MKRVFAFAFFLASCAFAGKVQAVVECYNGGLPPTPNYIGGSDYCHTSGSWGMETESASIAFGSKVAASSLSSPLLGYAGFAEATFSGDYVFTLTGGTNLVDFDALGMGLHGTGAFALACFTVVNQVYGTPDTTVAYLGPWRSFHGSLCTDSEGGPQPVFLNVPITLPLTLTAYSIVDQYGSGSASAEFDGFQFFDAFGPQRNQINVTYTFTAAVPEPCSFAMIAGAAVFALIFRRRLSV